MAGFLDASEASPPWDHASELLADGLIDVHFDLYPARPARARPMTYDIVMVRHTGPERVSWLDEHPLSRMLILR